MIKSGRILQSLCDVLMPRICSVCHGVLSRDEQYVCRQCLANLPPSRYDGVRFSGMDERFAGKVLVQRTYGYYAYRKGDPYCNIIHDIKYRNLPQMGRWMGALAAREANKYNFFQGTDVIVPVPMHPDKLATRGYNQAEWIARGISDVTGLPVMLAIETTQAHSTQTKKHRLERWDAAENIYALKSGFDFTGKRVLLVDDVITTGATLTNCAKCLEHFNGILVSIMTLAVAEADI